MQIAKKILNVSLVILSIISIFVSGLYMYYHFFVKDLTIGVNYIGDQIGLDIIKSEDLTDEEKSEYEERWFMEANYYSNDANNGIELQELNFNYFTDYTLTSEKYRSTGMQYIGNYKHHTVSVSSASERDNYVFKDFYYYDTTDGISFNGYYGDNASVNTLLKRSSAFVIKLDNRAFLIQLDKYWSKDHGWWIFGYTQTHYYTYSELFESVLSAVKSNSDGYGDYYIKLDISDFFSIKEYDRETGKFKDDDVTDIIKNYAYLKFHYDENGAKNSTQSIFGMIENNSNYGVHEGIDTTYWKAKAVYTFSETSSVFDLRYSDVFGGNLIRLSSDARKMIEDLENVKIKINLNIDIQDKLNIVGIDYSGLENIELESITITGNGRFYCLENSLKGTNVKKIIRSSKINLDIHSTAIDSEYSEVIL